MGLAWSFGVGLPVLGFAVLGVLWATVPPDSGTARIPGLSAPVDMSFDTNGVPRIRAASERDAAASIGYVHARDRMFQMELMRRAASGRLSEIAGPATLPIDKQMRVFGLGRLAEGDVAAQTPDARALLDAYAAGVNTWIAERGRFAALEFLVLGQPEPWKPSDSLLWGRTMGLWLSSNYRTELARQALRDKLPAETLEQLWPPHPAPLRPQASLGGPDWAAHLLAALPTFPAPFTLPATASNAWAVDGRMTDTGAPLLAGDPHLAFGFPGLWYLLRVETPGHVLAGATGPGVPFLILGRNEKIAWTFTTTGADTQDVYLEPPEAITATREERIKVRGQPDTVFTVRETRHGPVISDLAPGATQIAAVAMTNLLPRDTGASGMLALNRAGSVEEAGRAAAIVMSPVQNLMVADRGKIALYLTGRVPIRRSGDGWAPVPGVATDHVVQDGSGLRADGDAFGWSGFASGEALPHIVAPGGGRLINANEPVAGPDFPVFMGRDTFRDWRARRIRALLDAAPKFSASDFAAMQIDTVSPFAVAMLPALRAVPGAAQFLGDWDGAMTENDPRPLLFNAWMAAFDRAVRARTGIPEGAQAPMFDFIPFVLSPKGAHFCGGDCGPILTATLEETLTALTARFGPDFSTWRWGTVHQAVFAHPFLRAIPVIGDLATSRIAVPGDGTTIYRADMNHALEAVHGASYRGVYDLADLDRSLFAMTPGQSGNPIGRHARDFLTRWRDGAMVLLGPKPVAVAATLRLEP